MTLKLQSSAAVERKATIAEMPRRGLAPRQQGEIPQKNVCFHRRRQNKAGTGFDRRSRFYLKGASFQQQLS